MTVEAILLVLTTLIALVAAVVAVIAVRAVKRLSAQVAVQQDSATEPALPVVAEPAVLEPVIVERPVELGPRVVQGRVIVPPTQAQVVRTALGRPGVRISVLVHGLARALRPENRDRIVALMRREYRHRRRERLRAGRQAIRMARPASAPSTDRLHEHLLKSKSQGVPPAATLDSRSGGALTDRMIRS